MLPDISGFDTKALRRDLDRIDVEESLYKFLRTAWKYMDPAPWRDGWHIDAICDHLQAVVDGHLRRLIINLPPRHCKSLLLSVAFPAWTWAQAFKSHTSGPGVQFLYASYNDKLSLRDSVKCRRLIESPWYQALWGDRFQLALDQNQKSRFSNSAGGERLITSISSGVTGEGGNIICVDDPQAANEVASEASINEVLRWWTEVIPTRSNDPSLSAMVIIQQRLHEEDLSGYILEHEAEGWTHLCLPGRYEADRKSVTSLGWEDPRTVEGELLWPERFTEESLKKLEATMGPYIFAGQIQQRPAPKGGGIILREWWQLWEDSTFPKMDFVLACLDTAYTTDSQNDPSGLIVWGVFSDDREARSRVITKIADSDQRLRPIEVEDMRSVVLPRVVLMNAWERRLRLHELVKDVADSCQRYKVDLLLIENKAAGISVAQEMRRLFANSRFGVQLFDPKSQDKMSRLISVQHLFAEGLIFAPTERYKWVDMVIKQIENFPAAKHDEFVDLTSMGLRYLRDNGIICRQKEMEEEQESLKAYPRGNGAGPLYGAI
jgi:predicted phage terminase large subunit-like protein